MKNDILKETNQIPDEVILNQSNDNLYCRHRKKMINNIFRITLVVYTLLFSMFTTGVSCSYPVCNGSNVRLLSLQIDHYVYFCALLIIAQKCMVWFIYFMHIFVSNKNHVKVDLIKHQEMI